MRKLIAIALLAIFLAVTFTVNSYAQGCVRSRPSIAVSPSSVTGPPDTTYFLTVTITNQDTQACGFTSFDMATSLPTGWTSFIRATPKSIFPQQSEIVTIDVKAPKDAAKQDNQAIITASSANHATPDLKGSATAIITIKDVPKACSISVDDITLRKSGTDVEKITFCLKEKVDVSTKISLRGNTEGQVSAQLLVDGKLLDSSVVSISPDNFATINFKNSIDTQPFGKSTPNVKIVASAPCASSEATREKQLTIDICDPSCLFTTSIAAPKEKQVGDDLITSIYTRNIGNKENLIAIEPAVCKDGNCVPMVCEISSIKLQPDESKSYSCKYKVKELGSHTIETKVFSCGKEETQAKNFFGVTQTEQGKLVAQPVSTACNVEPLAEFRCSSGNIMQQLYRNSDCSTTWAYSQYCPNGCSSGVCQSEGQGVRGFEPVVSLDKSFESKIGADTIMTFELENTINSPAKFDIKVSGKAANWISIPSSVIVGEKAKERISFSASIPSDAKAGEYNFTVTVSTGVKSVSKSSALKVAEEKAQSGVSIELVAAIIGGLLIVFVLLRLLQSKYDRK